MNDRELLELAAKAAGYKVRWHEVWQCFVHKVPHNTDNPPTLAGQRHVWVPLTDDGDALRLAVKLDIQIWHRPSGVEGVHKGSVLTNPQTEPLAPDPYAGTRRAIVRAAAAIAQQEQPQ